MSTKLICADNLYFASQSVLRDVKNHYDVFDKHIIIVPDKYTMMTESLLLDELGVQSTFKAEVLSINRLCQKVLDVEETLNIQGGIILIHKICQIHKEELKFLMR